MQVTLHNEIMVMQVTLHNEVVIKLDFSLVKTASTPIETNKTLLKDEEAEDVDVYLYKSMIGLLIDYVGASLDKKSTTRGCQFLRKRLISWQCKKQIVVANSTTEAEYVVATNCYGQFWQTATTRTLDNGEMEITATIDRKVKIVTEASVRRHLKLEDFDGISILPTTEIFEQLALMGYVSNSDKLTIQKGHFSPQWRFLIHTILHCLSAKKTTWEQFSNNIATALICLATNRTFNFSKMIFDGMVKNLDNEAASIGVDVRHEGAATTGRYEQDMEFDFDAVKEVSTAEQVSTAGAAVTTASVDISPASPTRRVSTTDDITMEETLVYIRRSAAKTKDKGKGIMEESESAMTKTKRQQEQERLGHEAAVRLQDEFDKEERQRIAIVHKAVQTFTVDEWENIRARVEADEELTQRLQAGERNKYSELFEATMRSIKDFVPMKSEDDKAVPKLAEAKSSKRDAEEELDQGRSKKQKIVKAQNQGIKMLMNYHKKSYSS
uniref:Ribonuclease H-like domain, reverse transcriptase, RNA-dependent DNA polymerase n=1 Tax=Tanacetum cinerariifolium TaxID=118510 RepID=A0A699HAF6_TANCI|nr:ribonuclease H-like domain, reverse transcriptase, RNA-dependent DNA polymerase [Tanacetum cinerariifolium]